MAGTTWQRTLPDGDVSVSAIPDANALQAVIRIADIRSLSGIAAWLRRRFDLSADMATINAHLAQDPTLAPLVADRPGRRVAAPWDGLVPIDEGERRWHPWGAYARRHLNLPDLPLSLDKAS